MRPVTPNHFILLLCQFFSTFGLMVLIPIMPLYMEKMTAHMGMPTVWAGLALSAPAIGSLFTAPIIGHFTDVFGHKKALLVSLTGFCISIIIMAEAVHLLVFIFGRILLGFCGLSVILTAYVSHLSVPARRGTALGQLQGSIALACLCGPIAGGLFMDQWGVEILLEFTALIVIVLMVSALFLLSNPPPSTESKHPQSVAASLFRDRSILSWLSAGTLVQAGAFGLVSCFVLYIGELSRITPLSLSAASLTGIIHALSWGTAFVAATYWGKRNDSRGDCLHNFVIAAFICGLTIFVLPWVSNIWLVLVLRLIQGFCFAALIPSVLHTITLKFENAVQGKAIGITNSAFVLGQLFGPVTVTLAYSFFNISIALICTSIFFMGAGLIVILNKISANSILEEAK
ncbi:MFS transporter [Acinetobacter sp. WZC-1]|uniref:MFS transporter n=1 Tax=Acinetobacter sp. WZC-1 TaxID=3459034 RepID=UPI00403DAFB1